MSSAVPAPHSSLTLTDVTIIDTTGAAAQPNMTVLLHGNRIVAVASTDTVALPADTFVLPASGQYLIPGLWDMHVHLSYTASLSLPIFIANGVTGVRDMGSDLHEIDAWRQQITVGARIGPRIVRPGPMLDGLKEDMRYRQAVTSAAEASTAVAALQRQGIDFIKVHNLVPREAYFAIAAACKQHGLAFVGHIPQGISAEEVAEAGQKSIEHTESLAEAALYQLQNPASSWEDAVASYADARHQDVFAQFVRQGVWYCPTLVAYRANAFANAAFVRDNPLQKYLAPPMVTFQDTWMPLEPEPLPDEAYALQRAFFTSLLGLVRAMHAAGVPLLAGTDPPVRGVFPGFSLHDELELLVQAGLRPLQALQAATLNPARFLGVQETLGSIEAGKLADLVLLDADPLVAIGNTRRIAAVVVNGRLLARQVLDHLLSEAESAVEAARS
jgi:imidazolonepropionase-like amidohydrolase